MPYTLREASWEQLRARSALCVYHYSKSSPSRKREGCRNLSCRASTNAARQSECAALHTHTHIRPFWIQKCRVGCLQGASLNSFLSLSTKVKIFYRILSIWKTLTSASRNFWNYSRAVNLQPHFSALWRRPYSEFNACSKANLEQTPECATPAKAFWKDFWTGCFAKTSGFVSYRRIGLVDQREAINFGPPTLGVLPSLLNTFLEGNLVMRNG